MMKRWPSLKPLSELTTAELRALAVIYRRIAVTATEALPARALRELAERYEAMAEGRAPRGIG
jgi:hypothetical protein